MWFLLILCVSKYLLRMRNNCYLFILCFEISSYMSQKLQCVALTNLSHNMTFFILTFSTGWKCIILFENLGVSESIIWILKYIFVMTNYFRFRFLNLISYEMAWLLGSWTKRNFRSSYRVDKYTFCVVNEWYDEWMNETS